MMPCGHDWRWRGLGHDTGERRTVGFGDEKLSAPVRGPHGTSPWAFALTTSVVGAATGWVIEEIARKIRKKKRR